MNGFGLGQPFDGSGFSAAMDAPGESVGPYIPEAMDCMRCGACLGGCPTFAITRDESQGPRGRVRMIEGVLRQGGSLSTDELQAFDACTLCRACETVCPSKMQYADLYRLASEAIGNRPDPAWTLRLLHYLAGLRRPGQQLLRILLQLLQVSGLLRLAGRLLRSGDSGLKRLLDLVPDPFHSHRLASYSPTAAKAPDAGGGEPLALFTGCMGSVMDTSTHADTIRLLNRLGHDVRVPDGQTCCGAIHAHTGDMERARGCARENIQTMRGDSCHSVLFNASGCGAFLVEYDSLLSSGAEREASGELPQFNDILDFLVGSERFEQLQFRPLRQTVAVHEPCSQRNVLKNQNLIYRLIQRIPGVQVIALPGNDLCCGAGGTRMITHPQTALPLRDKKISALCQADAELLISTNMGCALHLAAGIRAAGHGIEVIHPVQLLARQLI